MNKLFSLDNPVMHFLGTLADLMILNLMWVVLCLPVVTAGAATVALQFACLQMVHGEEQPIRDFWRSFRLNFKQATVIWLIVLLGFGAALAGGYCILIFELSGKSFLVLTYIIYTVLFLNFCSFLFPMVAQFENSTVNLLRNAFILSAMKFWPALLNTILCLTPVIWACLSINTFLRFGFIWITIGFAAIAFLNTIQINRIFKLHISSATEQLR